MFLPAESSTKIDKFNVVLITENILLVIFTYLKMSIYCIVTRGLKSGKVESEKTATTRQLLVETLSEATNYGGNGFWRRHIHSNNFLKDKKHSTETLQGGDLYSTLPKL
jgi:hypothetical protein